MLFRDDIDDAKAEQRRAHLLATLDTLDFDSTYQTSQPSADNRFSFRPEAVGIHYRQWPKLTDLCAVAPMNGLMEKRGGALIDIEKDRLEKRMRAYFDVKMDLRSPVLSESTISKPAAGYEPEKVRSRALITDSFSSDRLRRYLVRPFDIQWCYYSAVPSLWNRARPSLWAQCWDGNAFLVSRSRTSSDREGLPMLYAGLLNDDHLIVPDASCFPIRIKNSDRIKKKGGALGDLFAGGHDETETIANLSPKARRYLDGLGVANPDADVATAGLVWFHALAAGCSSTYLSENADGVRADWPRIPLPAKREALEASAALGRQVAALLDTETPVAGVTSGTIRPELRAIGNVQREGGGALKPREFQVTAGWGHAGRAGVTMPGRGRAVARAYMAAERAEIGEGAALLGEVTWDIYLNETAYWANVPERVWGYTIGGYQVMKKWLSYREYALLGRALTGDELREVRDMARRIAALLLLQPALDASYRAVAADTWPWPRGE